ncbi:MAG: hypothetical protein ACUVYA_01260 [Planctomycetota bacterium]
MPIVVRAPEAREGVAERAPALPLLPEARKRVPAGPGPKPEPEPEDQLEEERPPAADSDEAASEEEARERWELAKSVLEELRAREFLVAKPDLEEYRLILGRLERWWTCMEQRAWTNCEGRLFNDLFFAAGGHGRLAEFQRSWVHLFRAFGCSVDGDRPARIAAFLKDLWGEGFQATQMIETDFFGAPLEGGRLEDLPGGELPPMDICIAAWEARADYCQQEIYPRFWQGLREILSEADFAIVVETLGVLNLTPP